MSDRYTTPLDPDQFQKALFQDGFPVPYASCEDVSKVADEAIKAGGYYTIDIIANGKGYVVQAFDNEGLVIANYVINRPEESDFRRIPTFPWLRHKFKCIGYDFKDKIIRQTHKLIESHIRDGGTWEYKDSPTGFHIELRILGQLKISQSFYKIELTY